MHEFDENFAAQTLPSAMSTKIAAKAAAVANQGKALKEHLLPDGGIRSLIRPTSNGRPDKRSAIRQYVQTAITPSSTTCSLPCEQRPRVLVPGTLQPDARSNHELPCRAGDQLRRLLASGHGHHDAGNINVMRHDYQPPLFCAWYPDASRSIT